MNHELRQTTQVLKVTGGEVLRLLKRILDEANVIKVVIRREDGRELCTIPGGYGSMVLLVWPRVSVFLLASVMVMNYEVVVHREKRSVDFP